MIRKLFIKFYVIAMILSICYSMNYLRKSFSLLIDFTCDVAKNELEKHPEMRTIAMIELENNFPSEFSAKIVKCLPDYVAKVQLNPHRHTNDNVTLILPKETLLIYIADVLNWDETFTRWFYYFHKNFPIVSHLSKHLIISGNEAMINEENTIYQKLLNVVQIYEKDQKVIAKSFDRTRNLTTFETFESFQHENLSQILFPDRTKNLNKQKISAFWDASADSFFYERSPRPISKWVHHLDIVAEKLNASLNFTQLYPDRTSGKAYSTSRNRLMRRLINKGELDFYLSYENARFDLESYNNIDWCFLAPLPEPYSITELILFLPMDKSCWMWLGITIAVSTLVWRISEGHWGFAYGFFSYFMGQGQLIIRIRTNRLTMKILLQLLIFAIFIFSNGYQSLVTSFMLNPLQEKLLKTVDEIFDSNLNIRKDSGISFLYKENPKYQKAEKDGRVVDYDTVGGNWSSDMVKMKFARAQPCRINKMRIDHKGDGKSWSGVYIINEVAGTFPKDLFTRPFHPLLENFQQIMDRSLEAGLHQAWERFYWEVWRDKYFERKQPDDEKDILDFDMIAPSLYILAFGFPVAFIALLFEIFWKEFVLELTKEYFERKWDEIFVREINVDTE